MFNQLHRMVVPQKQRGLALLCITLFILVICTTLSMSSGKVATFSQKITTSHVTNQNGRNEVEEAITHTEKQVIQLNKSDVIVQAVKQNATNFQNFQPQVNWDVCGQAYLPDENILVLSRYMGIYSGNGDPLNEVAAEDDTSNKMIYFAIDAKKVDSINKFSTNNNAVQGLFCNNAGNETNEVVLFGAWSGQSILAVNVNDI